MDWSVASTVPGSHFTLEAQIHFALQNANVSRIFETLGAKAHLAVGARVHRRLWTQPYIFSCTLDADSRAGAMDQGEASGGSRLDQRRSPAGGDTVMSSGGGSSRTSDSNWLRNSSSDRCAAAAKRAISCGFSKSSRRSRIM